MDHGTAGFLRFQHGIVYMLHLVAHAAYSDGTGHIGAIAAPLCAKIHRHKVAVLNALFARLAVRQAGFFAAYKNSGKRKPAGAVAAHKGLHLQRKVNFPRAGAHLAADVGKTVVGDLLRAAHAVDFLCVFQLPHLPHGHR
ncbi:hypothetical protein SDC9_158846 [bioreactor metagenome]|uniref:Uncharacterized protein n=1 Tax=bioreactor metagenome TaxID=1076179 RepID=A0A645FGY1_9ZZZZ